MCHWCKIWNTFSLCIYKFIRLLHYLWMHQTEIYKDLISITFVTQQIWNAWCIGVKTALLWRKWRITYAVGNNWSSHVASNHFNMQWIYWKVSGKHQHIKRSFLSKCQANFLKRKSVLRNKAIVLGYFGENYQFIVQDEIQSYCWNK